VEGFGKEALPLLETLTRTLEDSDGRVQAASVAAIGAIGSEAASAVPALSALLDESHEALHPAVISALGKVGEAGAPAIPRMIEIAESKPELQERSLLSFAGIGSVASPALPLISRLAEDARAQVRASAFVAAGQVDTDPKTLLPLLLKGAEDDVMEVRHQAVQTLGRLRDKADSASPRLFALLDHSDDRSVALEALRQIGTTHIPLLIQALSHSDPLVKAYACDGLARLGKEAEEALPALRQAAKDRYEYVRRQAEIAVKRIESGT
jgi:HEAT repeat protein